MKTNDKVRDLFGDRTDSEGVPVAAVAYRSDRGEAVTTSWVIAIGTDRPHRAVLQLIQNNFCDFKEFGRVAFEMQPFETAGGTQVRRCAVLNEQQATLLVTFMRNSDIVRKFKKRLVKEFYELRDGPRPPTVPQTYLEALEAAVASEKRALVMESERDEAIRTKAWISDKKTATAMARASAEKRRADKLAALIEPGPEYISLRQMAQCHRRGFSWKALKECSEANGLPIVKVSDPTYGRVNAYHKDVWATVYGVALGEIVDKPTIYH